jgi:hypothetical protein
MVMIAIALMCANILLSIAGILITCKAKIYSELWVYALTISGSIFNIVVLSL